MFYFIICVVSDLEYSGFTQNILAFSLKKTSKVQNPLGARPGLGTQPCYEAPGDFWVKYVQNAVTNIRLVRLSP